LSRVGGGAASTELATGHKPIENRHNLPHISADNAMPMIKSFGAYKITLYAEDHNPPHVHVIGPDFQAKVRISDATVFAGMIPSRHRRQALAWIAANRVRLMAKWDELR
jgi:hypothetical protein